MKFTFWAENGLCRWLSGLCFVFYVTPRCCRGWNGSLITDHRAKKRGHVARQKLTFNGKSRFRPRLRTLTERTTHATRKPSAPHIAKEEKDKRRASPVCEELTQSQALQERSPRHSVLSVSRGRAGTTVNPGTPNPGQATFGSTYEDQAATVPTKRLLLAPSIFQACSTSQRRLSVSVANSNTAASKCGRRTARSRRQVSLERSSMPRTPRRRSTAFRNEVRPSISNSTGAAASHTRPKQASTGSTTSRNLLFAA